VSTVYTVNKSCIYIAAAEKRPIRVVIIGAHLHSCSDQLPLVYTRADRRGDRPSNCRSNRCHVSIKNKLHLLQWPLRARNKFLAKIGMLTIKLKKSSPERSKCICQTKFSILVNCDRFSRYRNWIITPAAPKTGLQVPPTLFLFFLLLSDFPCLRICRFSTGQYETFHTCPRYN